MLGSLLLQLGQCARVYGDRHVDIDFSVVFGAVRGLRRQICKYTGKFINPPAALPNLYTVGTN